MDLKEIQKIENKFIEFQIDYIYQSPEKHKEIDKKDLQRTRPFNLVKLFNSVNNNKKYSDEEIDKIFQMAIDINLEYYAILLDIKSYPFIELKDAKNFNKESFLLYSQWQSIIFKTSVLWERLLNLIYFLIFHETISRKVRNKKKDFFYRIKNLDKTNKWKFILGYKPILKIYDRVLTNPEKHGLSILKEYFITEKNIDTNVFLRNLNQATNAVWENICSILKNNIASYKFKDYWQIHKQKFQI